MTSLLVLMGNQLFPSMHYPPPAETQILLVEDASFCTHYTYHRQKLGFVLAAMREHASALTREGYRVNYYPLDENASFAEAVASTVQATAIDCILGFLPNSHGQQQQLQNVLSATGLPVSWLTNPMFLCQPSSGEEVVELLGSGTPRMASFYQRQRRTLQVLMEGPKPLGGKWSLDADNRKSLPAKQPVPQLPVVTHSATTLQALKDVDGTFGQHPGVAADLWLPTTRSGALTWLTSFLTERFVGFGTYEDAISTRSPTLFHSQLSVFLNVGLLTPQEVLEAALATIEELGVPLNDAEGFIRQLIGWREFVRLIYQQHGTRMRRANHWKANRSMGPSWVKATTGILPLDNALATTERYAWNHHIERLMVIANFHNLCEIHPAESYRFFMENYLDAFDWVMVPNVFGMGLMSDGGTFATKPYICGSNYLLKMADYGKAGKGEWCDVADGLYWRFINKHRDFFAANARLKMMLDTLDRMAADRKQRIFAKAENFIAEHTIPR